jgi:RIO kinase 1
MGKRSKHGRERQEVAWKNAEVDALYKLDSAGVRVPKPYGFFDGVLLMEVITDVDGNAAPRLNEVDMSAEQAREWHAFLMRQIVLMLCAGLIHGDLSEYNVLVGSQGPELLSTDYAHEIWKLYEDGALVADVALTGKFQHDQTRADVGDILMHIDEARDEAERRERGRREAEASQD